jgi:hypothetical protein
MMGASAGAGPERVQRRLVRRTEIRRHREHENLRLWKKRRVARSIRRITYERRSQRRSGLEPATLLGNWHTRGDPACPRTRIRSTAVPRPAYCISAAGRAFREDGGENEGDDSWRSCAAGGKTMFSIRVRALAANGGASCIKLPAAVAFPTDARLLERIETSRRALPLNSVKPLRRVLHR